MGVVDVSRLKYALIADLDNGKTMDLTQAVMSLSWGEQARELAQKATIRLANSKTDLGYVSSLLKLFTKIRIEANGKEVFSGIVWEWDYVSELQKEISIVAYDMAIYLQQSKSNTYFPAGKGTDAAVKEICKNWSIPINYTYKTMTHSKIVYRNMTIADQVFSLLNECKRQAKEKYCVTMRNGQLNISACGTNSGVYVFESNTNVISTKNSFTCTGMVTQIVISGKADDDGRVPNEAIVSLKTQYGPAHIQDIQYRDTDDTLEKAKTEAEWTLEEKGRPTEEISFEAVDVPFIRKGDKVKVMAGNLTGYFYVTSITHNADSRTMDVGLERTKDNPVSTKFTELQTAEDSGTTITIDKQVRLTPGTVMYEDPDASTIKDTSSFDWNQTVNVAYKFVGKKAPYVILGGSGIGISFIAKETWTEVKQ